MSAAPQRMIVGITGATGIQFGIRALEVLREMEVETHLVVSRAGEMTRAYETDMSSDQLHALADHVGPPAHSEPGLGIASEQLDQVIAGGEEHGVDLFVASQLADPGRDQSGPIAIRL